MAVFSYLGPNHRKIFAGETKLLRCTIAGEDVSAWTMEFKAGNQTVSGGSVDVASEGASGIVTVTIAAAVTLALAGQTVRWELRRTDVSNEAVVAEGTMTVQAAVA